MKLSKTQLHKKEQSGRFLPRLFGPLPKTDLPLNKNVLKPLAKSVLIPLELTTVQQHQQQMQLFKRKFLVSRH